LNKIDAVSDPSVIEELKKYFKEKYGLEVIAISALTGEGLKELKYKLREIIEKNKKEGGN
jgi:GTP-binding protein